MVSSIEDVNHPFSMAVAEIGRVWRSIVHHCLVNGIGSFVGENTRGQTGNNFLDIVAVAHAQDVVVDGVVLTEEVQVCPHVVIKSSNLNIEH